MNLLLVLCLTAETVLAYLLSDRDICSAWVIACALFLVSSTVAYLNAARWGFSVQPRTIFVICSALFVFGIGQLAVTAHFERRDRLQSSAAKPTRSVSTPVALYQPSGLFTILVTCIMLLMLIYYVRVVYAFSVLHGNTTGLRGMISAARAAVVDRYDISRFANHLGLLAKAVAYIFAAILLQDQVYNGFHACQIGYAIPLILYLPFFLILGDRGTMIHVGLYLVIVWAYFVQSRDGWTAANTIRILLLAAAAGVLFLLIFRIAGLAKNSGVVTAPSRYIAKYMGFSIVGFDTFLSNPFPDPGFFGGYTLRGVYAILNRLGITHVTFTNTYLPFIFLHDGTQSNIYTALARYIEDYGYAGMYAIMGITGAAYSWGWNRLRRNNGSMAGIMLYAMLFYPIGFLSIDDCLIGQLISANTLYQIVYMLIGWCIISRLCQRRTVLYLRNTKEVIPAP